MKCEQSNSILEKFSTCKQKSKGTLLPNGSNSDSHLSKEDLDNTEQDASHAEKSKQLKYEPKVGLTPNETDLDCSQEMHDDSDDEEYLLQIVTDDDDEPEKATRSETPKRRYKILLNIFSL